MNTIRLSSAEYAPPGRDRLLEEWIAQIAQGGASPDGPAAARESLAALYHETKNAVYGFALSILKNAHDAEDVLQETYLKVYAAAGEYRSGKPLAWILTIARNLSLMKLREQKRSAQLQDSQWEALEAPQRGSEEDRLVLETVLSRLSPEESQIVLLHAAAGFKHREIAAVLELPIATVISKYHRALKKLKAQLEVQP